MTKQYLYVEELKNTLNSYREIDSKINELETNKGILRDQIEKWLDLHGVKLFETEDANNQLWKISKSSSIRRKIKDYDILESVLPKEHKHLIVRNETETFAIRKIDKHSKEWFIQENQ
jgi:hypothetical protein